MRLNTLLPAIVAGSSCLGVCAADVHDAPPNFLIFVADDAGMDQFDWYDHGFWPDYIEGRWNAKAASNFADFLDKTGDRPFFLWVGFVDPHRPYQDSVNAAPVLHSPQDVTVPPFLVDDRGTREDLARYYDEISRMDRHISRFLSILEKRQLDDNTVVMFISDNGFQ